jgi:hypothetical protein
MAGNILELLSPFYSDVRVRSASVILCISLSAKLSYGMRIEMSENLLKEMC